MGDKGSKRCRVMMTMQLYTEIKLVVMNFRTLYNGFIVIGNTSIYRMAKQID